MTRSEYIEQCPHCLASLVESPIPEKHREMFGGSTHFSRLIAIYSRELDRTTHYRCPDCEKDIPPALAYKREPEAP